MPIHSQFYRPAIWTSKVGQGDLVFDVRLPFAIGSVCAKLEVSVYSGYDLCHPGCPKMWFVHFEPLWPWKVGQTQGYSASMTGALTMQILWPQVPADILHISIFVIAQKPTKVGQGDPLFVCNQGSLVDQYMQDYKYLCTAVTICVTLFVPKFDLSIVTPVTSKSGTNPGICCTKLGTPTIQIWWPQGSKLQI